MRLISRIDPAYDLRELQAVFLKSGSGTVEEFESRFASKFGCRHGVMFPYGRSGLFCLFKAWGLTGSEIICPAYTCVVVPHAVVLSGNVPVFVDCARNSYNMDYIALENALGPKTGAVIVTHLFGHPMDTSRIESIVHDAECRFGHSIHIVQDAAHSFGCTSGGRIVTAERDCAIFGLNVSKMINSIFGGMVITSDDYCAEELRRIRGEMFREPGLVKVLSRFMYFLGAFFAFRPDIFPIVDLLQCTGALDRLTVYYREGIIDFPADWDTLACGLEARIGLVQLEKYDRIIAKRRTVALKYSKKLEKSGLLFVPPFDPEATYSHFTVLASDRELAERLFMAQGVRVGRVIDYSIPELKAYLRYSAGKDYPVAARYARHAINIPLRSPRKIIQALTELIHRL
ncbi:MAG: DegT/DnrJ/EryC1/StrS aminotransferase family protein [Candidatus Wallbacteria bacterium]|nr:DegT/DnrJ/EryC1/StrS aminotransferase family protein [Candidatus Wallbacteria bacterium]